ncbi:MAG TPA: DUF4912 domain-containing protein [Thermotogota bacterium]|nr:DUF4912 domain-containing protein [Thermotogota bacterium]
MAQMKVERVYHRREREMSGELEKKSVEELKEMAKKVKIKGYYKMRKSELIEALSEEQTSNVDEESRKSILSEIEKNPKIYELRNIAKRLGITFQRNARKDELKERILRLLARPGLEIKRFGISSGPAPEKSVPVSSSSYVDLPSSYYRDTLQGLPVNPSWLSFYWDFSKQMSALVDRLSRENQPVMLRVYDVTFLIFNGSNAHRIWEYRINGKEKKYYVQVASPAASYLAEIGYYNEAGVFVPLLRSNLVKTPASSLSNRQEERWIDLAKHLRFTQTHISLVSQPTLLPTGLSSLSSEEMRSSFSSVLFSTGNAQKTISDKEPKE